MIGLDANILVRYLAQDDPVQSAKATEIIERRLTTIEPGFASLVALAETVWVLRRSYRLTQHQLETAIGKILESDQLQVQHDEEALLALRASQRGEGAFADALIGALGAKAGCAYTLTFDRKALRLPWFVAA